MVRPVGFEPTAFCSGGKRSIQTELRAHKKPLARFRMARLALAPTILT